MKKITVYSKPNCMQCEFAKKYLRDKDVEFKEIDVFEEEWALTYIKTLGFKHMPIVDIGGVFHTGFRPDILAKVVN